MQVVHKKPGSDLLTTLPKPPKKFDRLQRAYWNEAGKILIENNTLKKIHVFTLEMLAIGLAMQDWAVTSINKKNAQLYGSGYVQVFNSGATNKTTEMVVLKDAMQIIDSNIKAFGMDPQSEKKLRNFTDPNQVSLLDSFMEQKISI